MDLNGEIILDSKNINYATFNQFESLYKEYGYDLVDLVEYFLRHIPQLISKIEQGQAFDPYHGRRNSKGGFVI